MKKIWLFIVMTAVAFVGVSAQNVSRSYKVSDFNGLDVSHSFKIELVRSDQFSMELTAPAEYFRYFDVKVEGGILKVAVDELPRKLSTFRRSAEFKMRVSMPELQSLKLSGAAKLSSEACFIQPEEEIDMECSGAAIIDGLCFQAKDIKLVVSGASKATMNLEAVKTEIELSGASKATLFGKTVVGSLEMSGASGFKGREFCFDSLELDQSGASRSEVWVGHHFEVDLSGSSHCDYLSEADCRLEVEGISGAAGFQKIKTTE